jgi:hypothetical protein
VWSWSPNGLFYFIEFRLFETHKAEIYKGAASLISSFESEPYFLLTIFKKLKMLDNSYLRQKLLITLDSLLDEKQETSQEVYVEEDRSPLVKYPDESKENDMNVIISRADIEELIRERVTDYLLYLVEGKKVQVFSVQSLNQLSMFVLSLLHSSIYSMLDGVTDDESEEQERNLTDLMEMMKANLDLKLKNFVDHDLAAIQKEILSIVLEIISNILDAWDE